MLRVDRLTKSFGGMPAVTDLSFTVGSGEVVALTGRNGSGKTTALRCIVGLERPDAGTIAWHSRFLDERDPDTRRAVCSLLDDWSYFPDLTVREHLDVYATAHEQPDSAVDGALDGLNITALADRLPGALSSGQSRRFALAQCLVRPWELLILDEPEQRLDVAGREWLGDYLRAQTSAGGAVLMASHDEELRNRSGARLVAIGET